MLGLRINSLKKNKANNKGMALITVIVAIGFIAALVSILLMTTTINFKMKNVNSKGKDTFYSAEQVLDEVNIGLQRIVSDCMSEAYLDIMNNYASYDSKTKTEMLTTMYYEKLWERLELADSHHAQYDVAILESFLKESTKWHDDSVFGENAEGGGYGAIIAAYDSTTGKDTNAGRMITYLNDGVVLKDLRVYYKDEKGFVSVIQTDIRLAYPQFDFAASSELPNIPYYCMIADGGAVVSSTVKADLAGNVYANNLQFTGPTTNDAKTKVVTGDDDLMIVKYNLELKNSELNLTTPSGVNPGKDTVLWANNIILESSKANINGTIQLKNDLNIKGISSAVKLTGEYVGFGTGATPGTSSSIVVNGKETTIDLSKLTRITIGGRAYAATNKSKYDSTIDTSLINTKNDDILMGESLAVKSNQLYYLVPACAIGVDEETGRSLYNKNPLTSTEYQQIKLLAKTSKNDTNHHYLEVSDEVDVPSLGTTLAPYIDYETNGGLPKAEKIFVRTSSGESLVYYYMAFDSEQTANTFFATYYSKNKDSVDRYMDFYLNEVKIPDETNLVTFRTVGNMIKGKATDEDGFERVSANTSTSVMGAGSLTADMMDYDKKFNLLCTKLLATSTSGTGLSCPRGETYEEDVKADQIVFENIVACATGDDRLKQFIDENPSTSIADTYEYNNVTFTKNNSKKVTLSAEGFDRVIICNDETDTIVINTKETGKDSSPVKLIITKGNVKIDGVDFDGLILCDGKLEVSGSSNKIHANPSEVRKCLQYGYVDSATGDVITVAYTLKDGDEYIYSSLDAKGNTANLALGGLISYENWKKE